MRSRAVEVKIDQIATFIDVTHDRSGGAGERDIDGREDTLIEQEAMCLPPKLPLK
ncbi:MAG TPA: hypothetical protein VFA81_08145 [Burkholderiales bacterium]|nr:hypothetical protein [Burkholderiales bacterium]